MKYVPKAITRAVGRTVLKTQKNSPTLLFVAGVGGAITATVLACRATLRVEETLDNIQKDLIDAENPALGRTMNDTEHKKMLAHIYIDGAWQLTKLYGPAVVVGTASLVCLTKSHRILNERNAQLTAAYVSLQKFLDGYRGRVRKEIGEEREKEVYYAATPVELAQDTPNGPKTYFGSAPMISSPYSCIIDETKRGIFQDSYEFNLNFIRIQQQLLTDRLRSQGYLFLNDVYSRFDVSHTATGQICGWFVDSPDSDDFVDITVTPIHDGRGSLMLDFNVAGNVFEMLGNGSDSDHAFTKKMLPVRREKS